MERNVTTKFKSKCLGRMVRNVGCEYKVTGLIRYSMRSNHGTMSVKYIYITCIAHWTRAYCKGERYNLMTSNIAESLNKALKQGRASPIVELMELYALSLQGGSLLEGRNRKNIRRFVPPYVDKVMLKTMLEMAGSKIGSVTDWNYEIVRQFGQKYLVRMRRNSAKVSGFQVIGQFASGHLSTRFSA